MLSNNTNVQVVFWSGLTPEFATCGGNPSYILQGGLDRCYSVLDQFASSAGGSFQVLALTYASCSSDLQNACMWTAAYSLGPNDRTLNLNSTCTTGGPAAIPLVTFDQYGDIIQGQRQPDIKTNSFSATPLNNAPFAPGSCYTPAGPDANGVYRSVRVYCDKCLVPAQYANLPTYDQLDLVPAQTTAPANSVVSINFVQPPLAQAPQCTQGRVGSGSPDTANQPYLVYWIGSSSCSGDPAFLAVGSDSHCFGMTTAKDNGLGQLDLTFLSCATDSNTLCAWTATYDIQSANAPPAYVCTTGTTDYQGTPIFNNDGQPSPTVSTNTFAVGSSQGAPFQADTCYTPYRDTGVFRSYKAYCSYDAIPEAIRSLSLDVFAGSPGRPY